jgi:hypothetical protein
VADTQAIIERVRFALCAFRQTGLKRRWPHQAGVPKYRIYATRPEGPISALPFIVECADDQEAIDKAVQAVNGKAVELWEGNRFIVRFPADGA